MTSASAPQARLFPSKNQPHVGGYYYSSCKQQQQQQQKLYQQFTPQVRFLSDAAAATASSEEEEDNTTSEATTTTTATSTTPQTKKKKQKYWTAKESELPGNQPTWYLCIPRHKVPKRVMWIEARLKRREMDIDRVHGIYGMILYTRDEAVANKWGFSPEYPVSDEEEHVL